MNFVAHFFLDRDNDSPHFAIGAATPDLLSIYNPEFRIKPGHIQDIDPSTLEPGAQELLKGIERHFEADRIFHSSPFFTYETGEISRELTHRFPNGGVPRKYFIAHVLLELVLDKVLISDYPDLLNKYYAQFQKAAPFEDTQRFTEIICKRPLPNYAHFLQKFLENKYLFQYRHWDHINYVLGRILRRVSIEERAFLDDPRFRDLMKDFEGDLRENYLRFFDEIHSKGA